MVYKRQIRFPFGRYGSNYLLTHSADIPEKPTQFPEKLPGFPKS